MQLHKFVINIGDWSNDGHCNNERIIVQCTKKPIEVWGAYLISKKKYEIDFANEACSEYEESELPDYIIDKLEELDCPHLAELNEFGSPTPKTFANMIMWLASLSDAGIKWNLTDNDLPEINGFHGVCRESFGYGLF